MSIWDDLKEAERRHTELQDIAGVAPLSDIPNPDAPRLGSFAEDDPEEHERSKNK